MAGGLFFAATRPLPPRLALGASVSALAALALTMLSARGAAASPAALACAQREVHALLQDLQTGAATTKLLHRTGSVHKRVATAIDDRYVYPDRLARFSTESCSNAAQFLVDPWGVAYWLRLTPQKDGSLQLAVYSMGPNRRRDHRLGSAAAGDDLIVTGALK